MKKKTVPFSKNLPIGIVGGLFMSRSEFRWNKKRKHYTYLFKDKGNFRKNILLHSDPSKKSGWNERKQRDFEKKHVKLFKHPNPNNPNIKKYNVEKRIYTDDVKSFGGQKYTWSWNKNDKRKIKRIKKRHRTR